MSKHQKHNNKLTAFLTVRMSNGDSIITSLRQINVIAESMTLIALDRYSEVAPGIFKEINPIAINPKYVIDAIRIDGKLIGDDE